jgi:4-aminobutyrate aminotransferase-like enzyme/Ser/Thr protein kinase RdoA (MazF antagonist)
MDPHSVPGRGAPVTLESQRPTIDRAVARDILREQYGIVGTLRPLPSERDQNFLVTGDQGPAYVLKISGLAEPRDHLDMQNALLSWVASRAPGLPVPALIDTQDDHPVCSIPGADGTTHVGRVLTWLPGTVLAETRPHSSALRRDLGARLASLDVALADFEYPATRNEFVWDPSRVREVVEDHRNAVETGRQHTLDRALRLWHDHVHPHWSSLRRQVIYNDANDHNVLVDARTSGARVTGFVDFGDALNAPLVCDPAIAIAYVMLSDDRPLHAAADILRGYQATLPLTEQEIELLVPLALARLAVSVCLSAERRRDAPDNAYLVVSEERAWSVLETLTGTAHGFARATMRAAGGLSPCPTSPGAVDWIARHANTFAPVIDPDPRTAATTVLDLSVSTTDLPDADRETGAEASVTSVFRHIAERGARIGIGRYDEARLIYLTAAFHDDRGEHPERRTVHLGVDLFIEAGAPVHAPMDGIVHSVRDNAAPLDYGPTVILRHEPQDGPIFFTLYGHLHPECLDLEPGHAIAAGYPFARVGCFEDNGRWPPHLHFQIVTDMLDYEGAFPGVALPSERDVWLSFSPDPTTMLGLPPESRAVGAGTTALVAQRAERLGPNLSLSYATPLHIVRGRGQFLYDIDGREYLDCVNNVCHVGHANPRVVDAARRQMAVLNTNTRYLHPTILEYADALRKHLPPSLRVCYFVNSGSEANDLALRMARTAGGTDHLIVLGGAYHGHTQALIEASPYKHAGPGGKGPPAHVHPVTMPDDYRGPFRRDDPLCGIRYADLVTEVLQQIHPTGSHPANFISETLLSCGGQIELPRDYLHEVYTRVRDTGGVCIADEVQVGFGRMGSHFWGFETQNVAPDIVTMGKPIGNGHPIGAVVTTPEIARAFDTGMEYFNTFGGNPVSCAVGLEVLRIIEDEGLQEHAHTVGGQLKTQLDRLAGTCSLVGDVRGRGLFLGVELVRDRVDRVPAPDAATYVVERMKEHGILLSTDGPDHNVIKIKPPLVFTIEDARRVVDTLECILSETALTQ